MTPRQCTKLATSVAAIVAIALTPGIVAAQDEVPTDGEPGDDSRVISVSRTQFLSSPFMQLYDGMPYATSDGHVAPLTDFPPARLGLDAAQIGPREPALIFSTVRGGFVAHDGGLLHLYHNRAYVFYEDGRLEQYGPLQGLRVGSLDALALLPDLESSSDDSDGERWAFSTATVEMIIQHGESMMLYPGNIYVYDGERIELLEATGEMGIDDIDALDFGRGIELSVARPQYVRLGGRFVRIGDEHSYALGGEVGSELEQVFDGSAHGLTTLDALSSAPCPCFDWSELMELEIVSCDTRQLPFTYIVVRPDGQEELREGIRLLTQFSDGETCPDAFGVWSDTTEEYGCATSWSTPSDDASTRYCDYDYTEQAISTVEFDRCRELADAFVESIGLSCDFDGPGDRDWLPRLEIRLERGPR